MIVLQASLGAAMKECLVRVAATAIGAAVAMPFVAYFGRTLIAFAVAVFATVLLCSILRLQVVLRVAATTVAIINWDAVSRFGFAQSGQYPLHHVSHCKYIQPNFLRPKTLGTPLA
jgi:uncharacterized membrane protein YgaE (UPF0421/DUF939 family)